MRLKEEILKQLEEDRGNFISGESLAARWGVSRGAVWKAIRSLEKDGFCILSVKNRGYALSAESDALSESGIKKYVGEGFDVRVIKRAASTNDEVKKLAENGAGEWSVVIAEEQSAGRGRFGRPFYSPEGSGLYMSILLRPKFPAADTLFITTSLAVAVCEAIEHVSGKRADIKWVNDIFMEGRKVSGTLTEASFSVESGGLAYAVVGVGVNVKSGCFPPSLSEIAGSVYGEGEYPVEGRARLAAAILERFRYYYDRIPERAFFPEYKRRSLVVGKRVSVFSGALEGEADVLDLNENCFLKVRFPDGRECLLSSGEVSIKLK